jgi:hypothetical protein
VGHRDYSGTPLPRKLGINEGATVAFVREPPGFRSTLGSLPSGTRVRRQARGPLDVIVYFDRRRAGLRRRFEALAGKLSPSGGLWIAWPKKSSSFETDLSFQEVQSIGLNAGLVDNKSCSIDDDWQAVRFVIRREDRPRT